MCSGRGQTASTIALKKGISGSTGPFRQKIKLDESAKNKDVNKREAFMLFGLLKELCDP